MITAAVPVFRLSGPTLPACQARGVLPHGCGLGVSAPATNGCMSPNSGLTRFPGLGKMHTGVAHAEPPPAGPSPACQGGKGTPDLGPLSWSVRLGQACWGSCGRDVDEGRMTANRNLKRRVRARAAKTGESYAAALRHLRPEPQGDVMPDVSPLRLATAQVAVREDPGDSGQVRQSGHDVRELMRQARQGGARIIHFPEGATCSPHKRIMSVTGPAEVGPADWGRADWPALRAELAAIARLAGELRLWTVLGSVHPLTPPHRPHNSMYVISDQGKLATRYDERLLSSTKLSFIAWPAQTRRRLRTAAAVLRYAASVVTHRAAQLCGSGAGSSRSVRPRRAWSLQLLPDVAASTAPQAGWWPRRG
jgi:hypothetical protein